MATKGQTGSGGQLKRLLDLPSEYVLNVPKLTMIGDSRLHIENHQGVLHYQEDQVQVACSLGRLAVAGEGLILQAVTPEQLTIAGRIVSVTIQSAGPGGRRGWA